MEGLRKIGRSMLRSWKTRHLRMVQNGLCPLCGEPIDITIPKEGVVDHDHDTGEIRGVLHRSCNAAEGKIANAAARWGCKSSKYEDIIPYLENVIAYLKTAKTGVMYPDHKTPDERRDARAALLKQRRANAKAKLAMRARKEQECADH